MNFALSHSFKQVTNDIRAGRVKDFSTLVDPSDFKEQLNKLVLLIVLVLVEGWEATVFVLGGSEPGVGSFDLMLVCPKRVVSSHRPAHYSIEEQEHGRIINVGRVLQLLSVRNAAVGLHCCVD